MRKAVHTGVRAPRDEVNRVLDELDARDRGAENNRRRATRHTYRAPALVITFNSGDLPISRAVPVRNISRTGIGFLDGKYVYPETECIVHLVSDMNYADDVPGKVARCRYLPGSQNLHEVGVAFDRPIELSLFVREATCVRVLVADDDTMERKILTHLLHKLNAEVVYASSAAEIRQMAIESSFDLIIGNMDSSDLAVYDAFSSLRARGYVRPLTCLTVRSEDELATFCAKRNCCNCEPIRFDRTGVIRLIKNLKTEPVVSSMARDDYMRGAINTFVNSLQSQLTDIEEVFAKQELERLGNRITRLQSMAAGCGFDAIADAAAETLTVIRPDAAIDIRKELQMLVRLCLAAQPASAS